MLGLTLTKTHRRALQQWGEEEHASREREAGLHQALVEKDKQLAEQDKLINSTERMEVLGDLEAGLNLVQAYQRVLSMMSLSDPNIIKANALLEKYGKKGDPNATILGAQPRGITTSEDIKERIGGASGEFVFDPTSPKTRWQQEEEYWGAEAYGSGNVRIEAEAVDEGDEKEVGYTRARIRFVDTDGVIPPALAAAISTTEEALRDGEPAPVTDGNTGETVLVEPIPHDHP